MEFNKIKERAFQIRNMYAELEKKKYGREWSGAEIMQGFVGDVGALMKLVMAKEGIREIEDADKKLSHELADCLWCVLVISEKYGVDIETEFFTTMDYLEKRIENN
jgi:NTP pyrophosphatase (non-canonical NTP hydrolase)